MDQFQQIDHAERAYFQPCPDCGGPQYDDVHAEGCPRLAPAAEPADVVPSSSGITITAADFSDSTTDVLRNVWTGGKLRAVAAVLQPGERVGLVVDRQTGHTVYGVELLGANGGTMHNPSDHARVLYHHSDGTTGETWHYARNLGPIFTQRSAVKWDALQWWREEGRKALEVARPIAEREHGQTYGRWSYVLALYDTCVKYEPQRPDAGPIGYGRVSRDGRLTSWSTYGGYEGPRGSYRDVVKD